VHMLSHNWLCVLCSGAEILARAAQIKAARLAYRPTATRPTTRRKRADLSKCLDRAEIQGAAKRATQEIIEDAGAMNVSSRDGWNISGATEPSERLQAVPRDPSPSVSAIEGSRHEQRSPSISSGEFVSEGTVTPLGVAQPISRSQVVRVQKSTHLLTKSLFPLCEHWLHTLLHLITYLTTPRPERELFPCWLKLTQSAIFKSPFNSYRPILALWRSVVVPL
jgi:hypothetical protein